MGHTCRLPVAAAECRAHGITGAVLLSLTNADIDRQLALSNPSQPWEALRAGQVFAAAVAELRRENEEGVWTPM